MVYSGGRMMNKRILIGAGAGLVAAGVVTGVLLSGGSSAKPAAKPSVVEFVQSDATSTSTVEDTTTTEAPSTTVAETTTTETVPVTSDQTVATVETTTTTIAPPTTVAESTTTLWVDTTLPPCLPGGPQSTPYRCL